MTPCYDGLIKIALGIGLCSEWNTSILLTECIYYWKQSSMQR